LADIQLGPGVEFIDQPSSSEQEEMTGIIQLNNNLARVK
jgi:hypothetical protein